MKSSEIFYTGGGIWCGVIEMDDGTWFSGELNDWGTFYKTREAAVECANENSEDFIRYSDDSDNVMDLWREAIEAERNTDLSCYVSEWLDANTYQSIWFESDRILRAFSELDMWDYLDEQVESGKLTRNDADDMGKNLSDIYERGYNA